MKCSASLTNKGKSNLLTLSLLFAGLGVSVALAACQKDATGVTSTALAFPEATTIRALGRATSDLDPRVLIACGDERTSRHAVYALPSVDSALTARNLLYAIELPPPLAVAIGGVEDYAVVGKAGVAFLGKMPYPELSPLPPTVTMPRDTALRGHRPAPWVALQDVAWSYEHDAWLLVTGEEFEEGTLARLALDGSYTLLADSLTELQSVQNQESTGAGVRFMAGYGGVWAYAQATRTTTKTKVEGDFFTALAENQDHVLVAIGERGAVWRAVREGANWTASTSWERIERQVGPFSTAPFYRAAAASGAFFLVVGDHGNAMVSKDSGKTWRKASLNTDLDLYCVMALPNRTGEFWVGGANGTLLHVTLE